MMLCTSAKPFTIVTYIFQSEYFAVAHNVCEHAAIYRQPWAVVYLCSVSQWTPKKMYMLCFHTYRLKTHTFCIRALSLWSARRGEWKSDDGECFLRRAANWNDDELRERESKKTGAPHSCTHTYTAPYRSGLEGFPEQRKCAGGERVLCKVRVCVLALGTHKFSSFSAQLLAVV